MGKFSAERARFQAFPEAWRLDDGTVEVVVIPEGGRIISFARVGGKNVLWVNPVAPEAAAAADTIWQNYGGDKVWPWPQGAWDVFGSVWPPPVAFDRSPFAVTAVDHGVRMVGPTDARTGMRVIREVRLMSGSGIGRLRTYNRIEAVGGDSNVEFGAWTVTQLPRPDEVRIENVTAMKDMSEGIDSQWPGARREAGIVSLPGGVGAGAKVGLDGDRLIYRRGKTIVTLHLVSATAGRRERAEMLQVYRNEYHPSPTSGEYVELELTGPIGRITPDQPRESVVEWTLE